MANRNYIKQLVLSEYTNIKLELQESVSSWSKVSKLLKSSGIIPLHIKGKSVFQVNSKELGPIYIIEDGSAIISNTDVTTSWEYNATNQSLSVDGTEIKVVPKKEVEPEATDEPIDQLQTVLDWLGFIPGYGDIIDVINASIYFARGMYLDGTLSLIAIIPVIGSGIKLGVKGAIKAVASPAIARKIWKQAASGKTDDLIRFYRDAIASGKLSKIQLEAVAKYGDVVADLLTSSKSKIRSAETALSALGVKDLKPILRQIDDVISTIKNTTSIPIKQSFLGKIGTAVKASKTATKVARKGKFAFNGILNMGTLGGFGIAKNLVKKIGIGKREMGYLKQAMDVRFVKKASNSPTLTLALLKSNDVIKKIPSSELGRLGVPPSLFKNLNHVNGFKATRDALVKMQAEDPKKWKRLSEYIASTAAANKNAHYLKFVENNFQQASNIFRPGAVLKSGAPEMFAKALKLDSYRLTNPKNLDIVSNEIQDLAEKLGFDGKDDPQGVIMPAIFMAFSEFLETAKDTAAGVATGGLAGVMSTLGSTSTADVPNTDTATPDVTDDIKSDYKNAAGTTLDKLNALYQKGYEDAQIFALKKLLDIE